MKFDGLHWFIQLCLFGVLIIVGAGAIAGIFVYVGHLRRLRDFRQLTRNIFGDVTFPRSVPGLNNHHDRKTP
jgi:hypothetical protein